MRLIQGLVPRLAVYEVTVLSSWNNQYTWLRFRNRGLNITSQFSPYYACINFSISYQLHKTLMNLIKILEHGDPLRNTKLNAWNYTIHKSKYSEKSCVTKGQLYKSWSAFRGIATCVRLLSQGATCLRCQWQWADWRSHRTTWSFQQYTLPRGQRPEPTDLISPLRTMRWALIRSLPRLALVPGAMHGNVAGWPQACSSAASVTMKQMRSPLFIEIGVRIVLLATFW